jgi:hypothetical protein
VIAELEAALVAEWSLDNLQVYGDALQAAGDPRGQLIAIDLHIAKFGSTQELAYRRRQRLREWLELPKHIDPTNGPWRGVKFAFGFVDNLPADFASEVLRSPAGRFVRGLSLSYQIPNMVELLHELAAAERPWLDRLSIVSRVRSAPPTSVWVEQATMMEQSWVEPVIAATPRLRVFELAGNRMVRAFPHPAVTAVRLDGIDALKTVLEQGPAMPAVRELRLAFPHHPDAPVLMEKPWPSLLLAANFPALTHLDLSDNRDVIDVLSDLGVREQIEQLRLQYLPEPSVLQRMPKLSRLEIEHDLECPGVEVVKVEQRWPRVAGALGTIWAQVPGTPRWSLPLAGLINTHHHARSWIDAGALAAWVLQRALDGLGFLDPGSHELWPWARFHQAIHKLRGETEIILRVTEP